VRFANARVHFEEQNFLFFFVRSFEQMKHLIPLGCGFRLSHVGHIFHAGNSSLLPQAHFLIFIFDFKELVRG